MKPRLIVLSVLLVAALSATIWQARVRWNDAQAKREENLNVNLNVKVKPVADAPPAPSAKPEPLPATRYADVATKNLFSKDRNPDVIIDPPKVEVPKPMPPLPIVYGVLSLPSGTRALMAEKPGAGSKPVRVGETIGDFTLVALDSRNITFEWDGKQINRKIEDLADRSGSGAGAATGPAVISSAPPAGSPAGQSQAQPPTQASAPATAQNAPPPSGPFGVEIGAPGQSRRACRQGDTAPAGTVTSGYRKNMTSTPFGTVCAWVAVQ